MEKIKKLLRHGDVTEIKRRLDASGNVFAIGTIRDAVSGATESGECKRLVEIEVMNLLEERKEAEFQARKTAFQATIAKEAYGETTV